MKVCIKLFASLADVAQVRQLELEAEEGSTLEQVWDALTQRYPRLLPHTATVLRAVNDEFRKPGTTVHDGDEVAFFPPVSGG